MEVRDPIHGAIQVGPEELLVVDHAAVQRLRNIRAMGFSQLPFPGATHSRYAHVLGAMHLSGQAFDMSYRDFAFRDPDARARFRSLVRVAALCHDLGHAPFSHCAEFAMPSLSALGIAFLPPSESNRRAHHEDYTIAILEQSSLRTVISQTFPFSARHVAALISGDVGIEDDFFLDGGLDHRRILSQIISSELDVDRLDYLIRDSYFTGARYGQVDVSWILGNLWAHASEGRVSLALDARAIYAFDDYLIGRHHMYLMVYFHHKSVVFEEMLKRYVACADCEFALPAEVEAYLRIDDVSLEVHLRNANNPWARRIVERRPYRRVMERHGGPDSAQLDAEERRLSECGIDVIHAESTGRLSLYHGVGRKRTRAPAICVLDRMPGMPVERVRTLSEASDVFERYADTRCISRLYVAPEEVGRARDILGLPVGADWPS